MTIDINDDTNNWLTKKNMNEYEESTSSRATKGKVLIVDDAVLHLETVKLYLEVDGFQVFCAVNTSKAWDILREEKPDLVVLDVVMPGENGLDFLRNLRVHFPNTGVVIMTAFGSEEVAAMALKLGAFDYIKKPFKYSYLSYTVAKALEKQNYMRNKDKKMASLQSAYEELQVSAESILQCMPAGVIAVDKNLCIRMANQRFIQLIGGEKGIVIGKKFYAACPEFKKFGLLKYTLENEKNVRMYEVQVSVSNKIKIININTDIIYDHHNNKIGAVATFEDITELRHKEELLRDRERLAIVGQMAAGMAHEIKNPLTAIKGFVQLLVNSSSDPKTKVYLDVIDKETTRMNQVIQDFLQLAKPKSLAAKLMTINELVDEMIPVLESLAIIKNLKVSIKTQSDIPPVLIDPAQIKQIILNLCQNGMEAMEEGGELTIQTSFLLEQGEVRLDISDTGCGIPQEKIKSVGVPFYTTKADGTGLGLSICFSIVNKHKGRIEIQSQEGKGTTFSVLLPVGKISYQKE